eukprot:2496125-Rhodomonas_salina.1
MSADVTKRKILTFIAQRNAGLYINKTKTKNPARFQQSQHNNIALDIIQATLTMDVMLMQSTAHACCDDGTVTWIIIGCICTGCIGIGSAVGMAEACAGVDKALHRPLAAWQMSRALQPQRAHHNKCPCSDWMSESFERREVRDDARFPAVPYDDLGERKGLKC